MRSAVSCLGLIILMALTAGFAAAQCPSGMIAWLEMEETAGPPYADSYDGHDAVCSSCPATAAGILGNGLYFDGTANEVDIPDTDQFEFESNESFTIEFWMMTPHSTAGNRVIVGRDDNATPLHMWVGANNDGYAYFGLRSTNNVNQGLTGTTIINDGDWHHIVAVRDESLDQNRLYVDGVPEGSLTHDYAGTFSGNANLNIGYLNLSGHYRYQGTVDEVAVYRDALDEPTITAHYNAGAGQKYCSSAAPAITSTPVTEATVGVSYQYDVEADGFPAPTYSLTLNPSGMTIDPTSGLIEWIPAASGDFDVTVVATNPAKGIDTQSFTIGVAEPPPCPADMISYWQLEEVAGTTYADFYDGNHGTASASPPTPDIGGIVGGCQDFNGTTDYITVDDDPSLDWASDSSFTIELWAKLTNVSSRNKVMIGRDQGGGSPHWWVGAQQNTGKVNWNQRDTGGNGIACLSGVSIHDDQWHHIVAVRDESLDQNRLYVDGSLEDTQTYDYAAGFEAATTLGIGYMAYNYTPDYYYDGKLDEIALYSRALTETEITEHYTSGLAGFGYCEETAVAPEITSTPVTDGLVGQLYSYDVDATGSPAPDFGLTVHPTGMTIDPSSGLIEWTPASAGDHPVTVTATNSAGFDDQSFTIHVLEPPDCPAGTAHYWPLDETVAPYADFWAGNDATCTNCPAWMAGLVGGAQWFDGLDDEVTVAAHTSFDWAADASFSLAFWMNTNQSTAGNRVILGRDDSSTSLHWWIGADNNGYAAFQLRDVSGNGAFLNGAGPILNDGDWHLIVAVRDESLDQNRLYVDGEMVGQAGYDYGSDFGSGSATVDIGHLNLGGRYRYHGGLDEIAFYDRALDEDEIAQQYLNGLQGHGTCETFSPVIVSTPVTEGTVGAPYEYDVDAAGHPAPAYSLSVAPAGMTIDPSSGLIEWTPAAGGEVDVTVLATNSAKGVDSQSFTIDVYAPGPCPGSMISYWRLDETAGAPYRDIHGAWDGGCSSCPAPVAGKLGGALQFDGATNEVDVADNDQYEFDTDDSFSIEFWMKTSASTSGNRVIVGRDASDTPLHLWVGATDGGQANFSLIDNTGHYEGCAGTSTINDGNWHHIVAVRDESLNQNRIYVDGLPENTITYDYAGDFSGSANLNIGYLNLSGHYRYEGTVDEIAIYGEALSEAIILAHYNGGSGQEYCDPIDAMIVTAAVTEGLVGVPYVYDVEAIGIPTTTYALTTSPAGMGIDPASGVITWTPAVAGDFPVTVEASNGAKGTDVQSFSVHVVEPPACYAGTIAYWRLDETVPGNYEDYYDGLDGDGSPASPTPDAGGIVGGCQSFNGSNNYITVNDDPALDWAHDASFSIVVWAKFTNVSGNKVMVGRDQSGGYPHWWLGAQSGTGAAYFNLLDTTHNGAACIGTTSYNDNQWHMFVAMRDKSLNENRLYVDGNLEDSATYDYAAGFDASTTLGIGYMAYNGSPGFFYNGLLDEIALFDRVLTVDEIEQLRLNALAGHNYCERFAPVIVTAAVTGFDDDVYTYDVAAAGHPTPTYSLVVAPPEMTIDPVTGVIIWTPDWLPPGEYDVTVAATNEAGSDQQSFTIETDVVSNAAGAINALVAGGAVQLSWTYDSDVADGFHVYRRVTDRAEERLTERPLCGFDGRISYSDPAYGIADGSVLHYSYGMIVDGKEIGRGTEVEVMLSGTAPQAFRLRAVYPNPFNPAANVEFELPRAGHVRACVYNVSGQLICTLVDEALPAATHLRVWAGVNDQGRPVPSGIYYLRLTCEDWSATQKMMLIK